MRKQRRWAHGSENVCGCKRNYERLGVFQSKKDIRLLQTLMLSINYIIRMLNADKQWKEMERAHFRKICIKHGLTVNGEIKTQERDSLSVLEYKAEMRKRGIKKLKTKEKERRVTLRNLQRLIKQALKKSWERQRRKLQTLSNLQRQKQMSGLKRLIFALV